VNVELRAARTTDAGAIGDILHAFNRDTPWMPDLYSAAETLSFCGTMIDRGWVTVAVVAGIVRGFIARDGAEVCSLYVAQGATGRGIGRHLLAAAKRDAERLELRTFAANAGARRFYLRHGFVEAGRGDGQGNDENLPDIAYVWDSKDHRVKGPNT
jgi:GNAT superfamily N-acetyltransferase